MRLRRDWISSRAARNDGSAETNSSTYAAAASGEVVLSGGMRLDLRWEPFRDGIVRAAVPEGAAIDQLFVNGQRQHMARRAG